MDKLKKIILCVGLLLAGKQMMCSDKPYIVDLTSDEGIQRDLARLDMMVEERRKLLAEDARTTEMEIVYTNMLAEDLKEQDLSDSSDSVLDAWTEREIERTNMLAQQAIAAQQATGFFGSVKSFFMSFFG